MLSLPLPILPFLSLTEYCRRVPEKFRQMHAIKVTAHIYWEISIVLFKRMPKPCLGGKGKDFKECKEFVKSSHSANDLQDFKFYIHIL